MKFKYLFFGISLLVIIPGLFSLFKFGLRLSIDFTGGTILELQNSKFQSQNIIDQIKQIFQKDGVPVESVQKTSAGTYIFHTKSIDSAKNAELLGLINKQFGQTTEESFETVGPVIGAESTKNALIAVALASLAIIAYVAYAFREVPKPYSSWKFGVTAVIALLHDVLVVTGIFSLLGHFLGIEIDTLFVTALLTVIGFSVHDTIVVYDRIRENLRKESNKISFTDVVNESLIQTLGRSLTTSLTVVFTLLALILFGGESIHYFVLALLIGIISGTYSSIFNAAPLLVLWEEKKTNV